MTVPSWPDDLPRIMRSGYGRTLPDGRMATKSDSGPPRVRRRYSAAPAPMQATIDVSVDQRQRFWRFWLEDTASGSLPWWAPDWTIDGLSLTDETGAVLTDESGTELLIAATILVMFGADPPAESAIGVRYRITLSLSILP